MPRVYVDFFNLNQIGGNCKQVSYGVASVRSALQSTIRQLDWDVKYKDNINDTAKQITRKLERYEETLKAYQQFIKETHVTYQNLDIYDKKNKFQTFLDELKENYGWREILAGTGYIGKIYNLMDDIKNGKTWKDNVKNGFKIYDFLSDAAITYNNYKKIGNAVGCKKAMGWWVKKITGVKPLGRASTAKNVFPRFKNNLTNKTSPFHAQFVDIVNDFKGANGVKNAVASWGKVAVNGVMNWFSNKEEQASSNGEMSDARVVAETITETAIDTALTYGTSIVVGAAVTAVMGTVAAPGLVVVATGGLIVAGINAGVKAATGKTTTEFLSDFILDTGEAVSKKIGDAAKSVSESVGKWFKSLSFT